jgi:hypothetical protein
MKDGGELVALLRQIAAIDFRTDAIPAHLLDTVGEAADALSQANARADAAETEVARLRNALTITVNALSATTDAETAAEARCAVLARELAEAREAKDSAYRERNQVVAALAKLFPSGTKATDIPGWDPEWNGCVYIDLPTGQVSWHYHVSDGALFSNLPPYAGDWDGHSTPEKYERLAAIRARSSLKEASDASKEPT